MLKLGVKLSLDRVQDHIWDFSFPFQNIFEPPHTGKPSQKGGEGGDENIFVALMQMPRFKEITS